MRYPLREKPVRLTILMDSHNVQALKDLAKKEHLSMSQYLDKTITAKYIEIFNEEPPIYCAESQKQ